MTSITLHEERNRALRLIDRFQPKYEKSGGAFSEIKFNEFVNSLKDLVANPFGITQGVHPLCGIASALKVAAELDPIGLVKMGANLYALGSYRLPSFLVKPIKVPDNLKKMEPTAGLSPASHVFQTTIKAFFNPITGYNNKPGTTYNEWQGITFPYQLKRFLTHYFAIDRLPARTYRHTVEEIQDLLRQKAVIIAWTSWNQMIHPGGKFKLLKQHYVTIRKVKREGEKVILVIDNPRKEHDKLQRFTFNNEAEFYKAIVGIYPFVRKKEALS